MSDDSALHARIAELDADNRRLRRLLDERDAPSELRHRLRSTLAMLRTIIRRSANTERDIDAYVGHVEDRLDALMRAQATTDQNGSIDIQRLLTDELLHYGASEGPSLSLSGPPVSLRPRAGQVFAMAVHELAVNAVEHGRLGIGGGTIAVSWSLAEDGTDPILTFVWRETNAVSGSAQGQPGFGTEVLTHMLTYELKAETSIDLTADGMRCTIRFRLTPRIGWVDQP